MKAAKLLTSKVKLFLFCRTVFQGVHNMWQFSPVEKSDANEDAFKSSVNKFVMIGRNLDRTEINREFKNCMLKGGEL